MAQPVSARRQPPPAPLHTGLERARLLARLDDLPQRRLAMVVAPPGSGKTTLMTQWVETRRHETVWYRANLADVSSGGLAPSLGKALAAAYDLATTSSPARDAAALAALVSTRPGPMVLVIDDLHVLEGTEALGELERFLVLAPPGLSVLLGSRRVPSFNLARSELPPPLVVSADELRFRLWEVEELFRRVYDRRLRPDDAAVLTRRTEGWAAALQLFHLSTQGRSPADQRRAVSALAGRSRYAQDYLSGEVLAGLPESLRHFLRRTCVFDVLTGDRCDALLGGRDGQRLLLELERRHALTTSDDEGRTFRYHEVLRRHLETALHEELGGQATREWYCRAADILQDQGCVVEALRARWRGEDWDGVRQLLRDDGVRLSDAEATDWADLLPAWLTEGDPWVGLAMARRLLLDGRMAAADVAARRAESQFTDPVGVKLCRGVLKAAAVWTPGSERAHRPSSRWDDVLRDAARCAPLEAAAVASRLADPLSRMAQGLSLLLAGDEREAAVVLGRCSEEAAVGGYDGHCGPDGADGLDGPVTEGADGRYGERAHQIADIGARLALGALTALTSDPSPAADSIDTVHREAERLGLSWVARVARGVAIARGANATDVAVAGRVAADCDESGDPWGAALVTAAVALAQLRAGCSDSRLLEQLVQRFRALDAGVLEAWARSAQALVATADDLPDAAHDARSAESYARAAGVPGALAVAYAAMAGPWRDDREELLHQARSTAVSAGMVCRPWAWVLASAAVGAGGRIVNSEVESGEVTLPVRLASLRSEQDLPAAAGAKWAELASVTAGSACPRSPQVDVHCFGGFSIRISGLEPDLTGIRPIARAALRLLALRGGAPVHREQLAELLWGDLEPGAAMHNVHVAVSSLRRALEPGVPGRSSQLLARQGEAYLLVLASGSRCDLLEFDAALTAAARARAASDVAATAVHLRAAMTLYTGDVLPEDGPAEWASEVRERYRLRAAEAAATLAKLELRRGEPGEAVAAATRSLQIERWRDGAWRTLIEAHTRTGDVAEAERARRAYRRMLHSLGVLDGVGTGPGAAAGASSVRAAGPPQGRPKNSISAIATRFPGRTP